MSPKLFSIQRITFDPCPILSISLKGNNQVVLLSMHTTMYTSNTCTICTKEKKKKIHKHSIVRPSFNPRLCTVHASHGMHGIIQQLCNEARVFFSPPTLLNSLLIPVVALWRRVAWCAIPFIKARKTSFCNPGYVNSPSHSSLSLRV